MQQRCITTTLLAVALLVGSATAARSTASLRHGRQASTEQDGAAMTPDFWSVVNGGLPMPTPDPFTAEYNLLPQRCPTGMLRVGCIFDSQSEERRWYQDYVLKEDRMPMTPDLCFAFCKNASGAQYFGLMGGDKCYCTPFIHDTGKLGHGDCDMPCVGDATRMCGGFERADVYSMHDCNNVGKLNCPDPGTPVNAKTFTGDRTPATPCKNRLQTPLTTDDSYCEIECEAGYELIKNTMKCVRKGNLLKAWGEVIGNATCDPVSCGMPPHVANSTYPRHEVFFPNNVTYECHNGFSPDALPTSPKDFTVSCGADGFVGLKRCYHVMCGMWCPARDHASPAEKGPLVYGDGCNYKCHSGYTLDQKAKGPNSFKTMCEANGNFSAASDCKPVDCGYPPEMQNCSIQNASGTVVYPNVAEYKCDAGYTTTGLAAGKASFVRQCQADGLFSAHQGCMPVECGLAPTVQHSSYDATRKFVYKEKVEYVCTTGHTLDGTASAATRSELTCGADGLFAGEVPTCQPVECGLPSPKPNAAVLGASAKQVAVYSDTVTYTCNEGHTLTTAIGGPAEFTRTCQASGKFTKAETCQPVNCGPPPAVSNSSYSKANVSFPEAVDYKCDKGFSTDATPDGVKIFNVTCLADGYSQVQSCVPIRCGLCPQGSGHYEFAVPTQTDQRVFPQECSYKCKKGYSLNQNASGPKSFETSCLANGNFSTPDVCAPVSCGAAEKFKHTSLVGSAGTFYPEVTKYECSEGYTLTGQAGGTAKFKRTCQADGSYSPAETCKPVSCGRPTNVSLTTYDPSERVYNEKVTYTCDVGHTLDGTAAGENSSTLTCGADGKFQGGLPECVAVSCGICKVMGKAEVKGKAVESPVVYPHAAELKCEAGYTLSGEIGGTDVYSRYCQATGKFTKELECKPVDCGQPPYVSHCTYPKKNATYGQDVVYTCDTGFSVTATVEGPKQFNVTCEEKGYEAPKSCDRIRCGACPKQTHAKVQEKGERVFEDQCTYGCETGYTAGTGDFNTSCLANGNFSKAGSCEPVHCGKPSVPAHTNLTTSASHYPDVARFECHRGYTLTGVVGGPSHYEQRCRANATYSPGQQCQPVTCGEPDKVADAEYTKHARVYKEKVNYKCSTGYSLDGFANGTKKATMTCGADGSFKEPVPTCLPVTCGVPPSVPHADPLGAGEITAPAVFPDVVVYECHVGYTLTGQDGDEAQFERECLADGTLSPAKECKPIDCGAPPAVPRSMVPADNVIYPHSVTYTCDRGHSVNADASGAKEFNITCEPGGFTSTQSCLAITCGKCPDESARHAVTLTKGGKVYEEECAYKCEKGHTLDSTASGTAAFNTTCLENGSFSPADTCMPVVCGQPPSIEHSTMSGDKSLVYSQKVKHTCVTGYTLTGKAGGATEFERTCQASGELTPGQQCKPVECGTPPVVHRADYDAKDRVYNETVSYQCVKGHTLTGTAGEPDKAALTCADDGTFHGPKVQCLPVVCGVAPSVANAKTAVSTNRTGPPASATSPRTYGESVTYNCVVGHTLDATAGGDNTSTITCGTKGTFEGTVPQCLPVSCGVPVEPPNTDIKGLAANTPVVYPTAVDHECVIGHSLSGEIGGPSTYKRTCQVDGEFSQQKDCKPVNCGPPPAVSRSTYSKESATYGQDVLYTCDSGFTVTATSDGPAEFNVTCEEHGYEAAKSCDRIRCGACPEQRHAKANEPGERIFEDKCTYRCESGYTAGTGDFNTTCRPDGSFSKPGACEAVYCGAPPVPAHTNLTASASHFPGAAHFKCDKGYTLTGAVGGPTHYERRCQADATYSPGQQCQPVTCGKPAKVEDANYTKHERVYKETVTYTCATGYTLDGLASGATQATMTCGANGSFLEPVPDCQPVTCGALPTVPHADALGAGEVDAEVVFPDAVPYECREGYTLTGVDGDAFEFELACLATGSFSAAPTCTPILCGPPPPVNQSTYPSGDLRYPETATYTCDKGHTVNSDASGAKEFSITCQPGGFTPTKKCLPVACGKCPDESGGHAKLLTQGARTYQEECSYKCEKGHTLDSTAAGVASFKTSCLDNGTFSLASTCVPVVCGKPPSIPKSTIAGEDKSLVYAEKVQHQCLTGYTLTGKANGTAEFERTCQADGHLTPGKECKPVECGKPPKVERAAYDPQSLVYNQTVTYTCAPGHTMNGSAAAPDIAVLTCAASGKFDGPRVQCVPVVCGVAPPAQDAKIVGAAASGPVSFPDKADYECDSGYTLDQEIQGPKSFHRKCLGTGEFSAGASCKPVICGSPPHVESSAYDDTAVTYPGNVTYTCVDGYSTDEAADGPKKFAVKCEATGFSSTQQCKKIICGACPNDPVANPHAVPATTDVLKRYMDECSYTCETGYTLDQSASGPKKFTSACQKDGSFSDLRADGSFADAKQCKPVDCGTPPDVANSTYPKSDVTFPKNVTYTCDEGYSTDATASGPKSFDASCLASGDFSAREVCAPVSCGAAESFNHTSLVGQAGTSYPEVTKYKCEKGYSLNGQAGGPMQFERKCQSDGSLTPPKQCQPVTCGRPTDVPQSTYDSSDRVYGESVTYTCDVGHTLDGTAEGVKSSTMTCGANGTFLGALPQCVPCSCGVPVEPANTEIKGLSANTPVVYPMKVDHECDVGYTLDSKIGGKGKYKRTCQADGKLSKKMDCKPVDCGSPPAVADSTYPKQSATYGQDVLYTCDKGFTVTAAPEGPTQFNVTCEEKGYEKAKSCSRVRCGACPKQKHSKAEEKGKRVFEDQCTYRCESGYTAGTGDFNTSCLADGSFSSAGSCQPVHCGEASVPAHTNLTRSASHYPDAARFECHHGYTLTGAVDGPTQYERHCLANATYSPGQQCQPVSCGAPDEVADSKYLKHERVYKESVKYTCHEGYSLDGQATGSKSATLHCGADGSFKEALPTCQPVQCGVPPAVPNADVLGAGEVSIAAVYQDKVPYECHNGYTLTGVDGDTADFERECRADGTFSPAPVCKPIVCGAAPAVAKSKHTPSGEMSYPQEVTYTCDEGFSVDADASGAKEFNITCQPGGFTPTKSCLAVKCGKCPDESARHARSQTTAGRVYQDECTYKCARGHTLDAHAAGAVTFNTSCLADGTFSQAHDCLPVSCKAESIEHSTMKVGNKDLVYADTVKYECEDGYTLNGQAGGKTTFSRTCQDDGTLSPGQECKPVDCGKPPAVERAAYDPKSLVYNQTVSYTCAPGHTLTGSTTAPDTAVLTCAANGEYKGPDVQCVPVDCGNAPSAQHAQVVGAATTGPVSFPDKAEYKCDSGYTLDQEIKGPKSFQRKCLGTGEFEAAGATCGPVICGLPPVVEHSTYEDVKVTYPGNVTYTCVDGYSTNEAADGPKEFGVKCEATGFSAKQQCKKIICGACQRDAAANPHAMPATTDVLRRYEDTCSYTCAKGYSLDQSASGPASFETKCLASGSFSGQKTCLPVSCPAPPAVTHASLVGSAGSSGIDFPESAKYECDQGYTLTGDANGQTQFERQCQPDGQYSPAKQCKPVSCGKPQEVQHATHDPKELFYKETVDYKCKSGYTLSGVAGTENQATMTCGADGSFQGPQPTCLPVQCGEPPAEPDASLTAKLAKAEYPNSVEYECAAGYSITGVAGGSRRFSVSCQADGSYSAATEKCKPVLCGDTPTVADSTYDSSKVGKTMKFGDKVTYKCNEGHTTTGKAKGKAKGKEQASYSEFTVTCSQTGMLSKVEECKPVRCGTCTSTGRTLKNGRPVKASIMESLHYFGETCTYSCDGGYTLDGKPSGSATFNTTCLANGEFSELATCEAVTCGAAEAVSNAKLQTTGSVSYGDSASYTCEKGYTLTGKKKGKTQFERECKADGTFAEAQTCQRVATECGIAPEVADAHLIEERGMELITDASAPLKYECISGYSTNVKDDPWKPKSNLFTITCGKDGKFSQPPPCVNIDDCAHHSCGEMGACEDVKSPSGDPQKDYRCVCQPGWEVVKHQSIDHPNELEQVCENINDCPTVNPCGGKNDQGQLRGECHDDIQSYGCSCNAGYTVSTIIGSPKNETCSPISCGMVPNLDHATHTPVHNVEANYETGKWVYTCDSGYTLTGKAGEAKSFEMTCQSSGKFTASQQCLPVSCGTPPKVAHAKMSPKTRELKYGEQVTYTCEWGYSVGGTFDSPLDFTVSCNADGTQSPVDTCDLELDGGQEDFQMNLGLKKGSHLRANKGRANSQNKLQG